MDKQLKEGLKEIASSYSPSEKIYHNIKTELKGESYMKKKINVKKFVICFGAAAVLLTAGVTASQFAAYSWGTSSIKDRIDHAPTKEEVSKEVDYSPKYAEKIGDYTLVSAQPGISGTADENHNKTSAVKDINFDYEKDGKRITLFTESNPANPFTPSKAAVNAGEVNGITLYYTKTVNKFLPPSMEKEYEPTEEEKKQMEEGTLNIAYGSDKEEILTSEHLSWDENGIHYSLLTMDNQVGMETLAQMAEEIINS